MRVAIVNYGMGNLASVRRALEDLGADAFIAATPAALADADRVVLPGVGAFSEGMRGLAANGWVDALHDAVDRHHKPLLGICLGMQMLASGSDEGEAVPGLGFVPGQVRRLDTLGCGLRVPHVGWNDVRYCADDPLFAGIPDGSDFYFVHSYAVEPTVPEHLLASTPYGCDLAAGCATATSSAPSFILRRVPGPAGNYCGTSWITGRAEDADHPDAAVERRRAGQGRRVRQLAPRRPGVTRHQGLQRP